jgi:predicted nucleotidyltransferase
MSETEIYDVMEIKRRLEPVFITNHVKSAVLFGSYALGRATADSDVDILVDSGLRGLDFVGLIENVREALQKNVDLIDVYYVQKHSKIEHNVNMSGVLIYGE